MFARTDAQLSSVDVVVSNLLGHMKREQFRKPRSKKRRIRRKWAKDPRNWREVHVPKIYQMGSRIVMDPISFAKLQGSLNSPGGIPW